MTHLLDPSWVWPYVLLVVLVVGGIAHEIRVARRIQRRRDQMRTPLTEQRLNEARDRLRDRNVHVIPDYHEEVRP